MKQMKYPIQHIYELEINVLYTHIYLWMLKQSHN